MLPRLQGIGRWSAGRPRAAIAAWLAFVVVCLAVGAVTGTRSLDNGATGESKRGYALADKYGLQGQPTEAVLAQGQAPRLAGARVRAAVATVPGIGTIHGPQLSKDHSSAVVFFDVRHPTVLPRLQQIVGSVQRATPGASVSLTGDISVERARDDQNSSDLAKAELLSLPVTLVILTLVFGSLVSALVPVLLALSAVAAALGLAAPLSHLFALDGSAKTVLVLIGMAVGVDYSLFYVSRHRQERRGGRAPTAALRITTQTSGRTVLVSGLTVAVALAGLLMTGQAALASVAVVTIAVVLCAVLGSLTALPAMLALLQERVDNGRVALRLRPRHARRPGEFWPRLVDGVLARPRRAAAAGVLVLLALALPALSLHTSDPSDTALASQKLPAIATLNRLQRAFPGGSEPADVVVAAPSRDSANIARDISRLRRTAVATGVAHEPVDVTANAARTAALIQLPLTGKGDNPASRKAIETLRQRLVPAAFANVPGAGTAVTGRTAEDLDFTARIDGALPYVIAFVLTLAFVLLLFAFRSIVIPLKAIILNLLSVGASYGVLVLVFQHHWAEGILGFKSDGAIIAWMPLFLFVILFGLSMDYHVFILSRVRELVDRGASTPDAVRLGISSTAGVVTGAALVMVAVFSLFATLSSLALKEAGVGLAAAVLIDATLVRAVLLPASMKLLGEWNWYLPARVARKMRPVAVSET